MASVKVNGNTKILHLTDKIKQLVHEILLAFWPSETTLQIIRKFLYNKHPKCSLK